MRKYNNKSNMVGEYLLAARKKKNYSKADLRRKLELVGVEIREKRNI